MTDALIHSPDKEKERCGASSSPATEDTEPEGVTTSKGITSGSTQSCAKCGHTEGMHKCQDSCYRNCNEGCHNVICECEKFIPIEDESPVLKGLKKSAMMKEAIASVSLDGETQTFEEQKGCGNIYGIKGHFSVPKRCGVDGLCRACSKSNKEIGK